MPKDIQIYVTYTKTRRSGLMKIRLAHTQKKREKLFVWMLLYRHKHQTCYLVHERGCCSVESSLVLCACECVCQPHTNQYGNDGLLSCVTKCKKGNRSKTVQICNFRHIFTPHRESHTFFPLVLRHHHRENTADKIQTFICPLFLCWVLKSSFCSFSKNKAKIFGDSIAVVKHTSFTQRERERNEKKFSHSHLSM